MQLYKVNIKLASILKPKYGVKLSCTWGFYYVFITVYLKQNFAFAVPPFIHHGELELSVVENSQAQLVCLTEGVPQPTLSWEKDGKPLTESTGEYTILPSGELVIDVAQVSKKTKTEHCIRQAVVQHISTLPP